MRKLIFLLFPIFSYGQITLSTQGFTSSTNTTMYGSNMNITTGKFYVVFIETSCATADPDLTFALTGHSPVLLDSVSFNTIGTPRNKIWSFYFLGVSTGSISFVFTFSPTVTGFRALVYEVSNCVTTGTNGIDAIVQHITNRADAGADPSITLPSLRSRNAVITGFANDVNTTFGGTEEAGWTLVVNSGHDEGGFFSMYRIAGSDTTPTVTASASDWGGIAIELRASGRRATVIN